MSFDEDLARVTTDPEMFRRAVLRARSRELAEDAIQETARAIAARRSSEAIGNLPGFFYVALIHEIDHQLGRAAAIPAVDIVATSDRNQTDPYMTGARPATPVEGEAQLRALATAVLNGLARHEHGMTPLVPARSEDAALYRSVVVQAAKEIFELLIEGSVAAADWNEVLEAAYPQWFDQPGLSRDARDQRLSRGRRDVRSLLRSVLSRDQLA
jgi:hypothetical protein